MPLIGDKAPEFAKQPRETLIFPPITKEMGNLLLPPGRLHAGLHHRVHDFRADGRRIQELNAELVGLSVDSLYAHIAWLRKINELEWKGMKNLEVQFPVIEDITMEVSKNTG